MKKTFTVNISGQVFHIDEDAFDLLQQYLHSIKHHFENKEGGAEIIGDIESRIAELMIESTNEAKQAITLDDVNEIINQLGQPFEIDDEEDHKNDESKDEPTGQAYAKKQKRFYRDSDHKVVGGVCSGLGAYFNLDPVIIRIIFALAFLIAGSSFWIYIILWIAIPEAHTTAEKLEMSGEPVNVDNIEKKIKTEFEDLKKRFGNYKNEAQDAVHNIRNNAAHRNSMDHFVSIMGDIFVHLARFFGALIGVFFIFIGIAISIALIYSFTSSSNSVDFNSFGMQALSIPQSLNIVLTSSLSKTFAIIGLMIFIGVPMIMLIYSGIKLVFGLHFKVKFLGLSAFLFWLCGAIILAIITLNVVSDFSKSDTIVENVSMVQPLNNTLYLDLNVDSIPKNITIENDCDNSSINSELLFNQNKFQGVPEITFKKSENEFFKIVIHKYSRGKNSLMAHNSANSIEYNILQTGDTIKLNPLYFWSKNEVWRGQSVEIFIYCPTGKSMFFKDNLLKLICLNDDNSYFESFIGKRSSVENDALEVVKEKDTVVVLKIDSIKKK